MAKAEGTAPAMHTILHGKKGVLKGEFKKILSQRDSVKMAKVEAIVLAMHTLLQCRKGDHKGTV